MLFVPNISEVAVIMKFDQGHQNSYVNVTLKTGKIAPEKCRRRTQNKSFRRSLKRY